MKEINNLTVKYHDRVVGIVAETKDGKVAFQYDKEWLTDGFSISPLSLPLIEKVFIPETDTFEGLYGVFADSLPDGWGRLLVDRVLLSEGISPVSVRQAGPQNDRRRGISLYAVCRKMWNRSTGSEIIPIKVRERIFCCKAF